MFPHQGSDKTRSMKRAIFPGSFDPITSGHVEIIYRGKALFDEIVVAIGINSHKKYLFDRYCTIILLLVCYSKYYLCYERVSKVHFKKNVTKYI